MNGVSAIILGGGRGTRLYPLTLERAKPAVGFAGKYRLIDIPISNCINSRVTRIFVLTQFQSASLHRHIMQTYTFDNFTGGFVDILAAEQTPQRDSWFQGTSDAVRATLQHTMYYGADQMVILSGDHLYRMDYGALVREHRESGADITICVYPVPEAEAPRMGLLKAEPDGRVTEFVEKPQDPEVIRRFGAPVELFARRGLDVGAGLTLANMGIYVFEPEVLRRVLADPSQTDFGRQVIPSALADHRVMAYPFTGYWMDIGTIGAFFDANISLTRARPPYALYAAGAPLYTRQRSLPPSRIIGSEIRDSLVVEGSRIYGARVEDSVIGMRSRVGKGSYLREVVLLGSDYYEGEAVLGEASRLAPEAPPLGVGRDCRIERAIIDKNVRIGDGVVIRAQPATADREETYRWLRDGVTVIPKGTVIPPGTVL
ncbi:MAG: glucose-1-phosphate adenylyltransferase [Candidatus Krumholzibacteriia bacterium]